MDHKAVLGAVAALFAGGAVGFAGAAERTYTLDADFAEGTLDGVNSNAPNSNQLQLGATGSTFPVMWIANAGESTVSRIDTDNNCETARYRSWVGPVVLQGAFGGPAPSRTAVDGDGNVYVANRHFDGRPAAVMKILAEGGIDRNGNGMIETSVDANNNCIIEPSELILHTDDNSDGVLQTSELNDERIAWIVQVGTGGALGRSLCLDPDGDLWLGLYSTRQYFKLSSVTGAVLAGPISTGTLTPYGCVVESDGTLWSASLGILTGELNTNTNTWTAVRNGPGSNYGIGFGAGKPHWANQSSAGWYTYDRASNTFTTRAGTTTLALSVGAGAGDVFHGGATVQRRKQDGALVWSTANPNGNTGNRGVLIDSNGDIWSVNLSSNSVSKFRGTDGAFLGVVPVGNSPYTYSDATGFAFRNQTNPSGFWTVIYDGGAAGTVWDLIRWNQEPQGAVPAGAVLSVQARAADVAANLPLQAFQAVTNGAALGGILGKFIQIRVRFEPNTAGESPILSDLSIASESDALSCDWDDDGQTDIDDINLMKAQRNRSVPPGDARFDVDGDGVITTLDIRKCILVCTNANCAR